MLKISFFLLLITTFLYSQEYPKYYSTLGTPLYKAEKPFKKLHFIKGLKYKADDYHLLVEKNLKLAAFLTKDSMHLEMEHKRYSLALKELEKKYNEIVELVNIELLKSIDKDNYLTFKTIINSNLDAILENIIIRKRSMAYYLPNRTKGKIEALEKFYVHLDSDANLRRHLEKYMPKVHIIKDFYSSGSSVYDNKMSDYRPYLFTANAKHCFKVVDVRDFALASEVSSFSFEEKDCLLKHFVISPTAKYIYLSDINNGFAILDVSIPKDPLLKSVYDKTDAIASVVSKKNKTAFVIGQKRGLSILDITNKEEPILLATYNRKHNLTNIALDEKNNRLYISHKRGLSVLDISTLGNPRRLLDYNISGGSLAITLSKNRDIIYLASGDNGIEVLDASDKLKITLISKYQTYHKAKHISISQNGQTIFISTLEGGVEQVDAKKSSELKHQVTYKTEIKASAFTSNIDTSQKYLYISYGKAGIAKIKIIKE